METVKYKGWDITVKHKDCVNRTSFEFGQTHAGVRRGEQPRLGCQYTETYKCDSCKQNLTGASNEKV